LGTLDTVLIIGAVAVGGWYVINYVLPNLPGGGGGQFVEGNTGGGDNAGSVNTNCIPQSNGTSCWKSASCKTSPNPAGRGRTVSWCVKGGCSQARDAWLSQFKCTGNVTPKPPASTKVTNCPGKSGNCTWDCRNAYCWTSTACGKSAKSCTSSGQSANRTTGCSVARNRFLGAYGNCGNSSVPYSQPPPRTTPGLSCTCAPGYVRDTQGTNATRCVCRPKPTTTVPASTRCAGLTGATYTACVNTYR